MRAQAPLPREAALQLPELVLSTTTVPAWKHVLQFR